MSQAEDLLNSLTAPVVDHTHEVSDSDKHFIIDPHTKQIKNTNDYKTILMQGDHNSQRLTFELPRYIDGHDMSLCNRVIIHFDNVGDSIENVHSDVAYMDDLQTNPDNPDTLISSWQIRREATRFVGIISFFIQYQCVEDEEVTYEWNTDYYNDIEVRKSKKNDEAAVIPYTNVLEQWRAHIFNTVEDSIKYTPQTLTPEQQAQTRENIGATSDYYHTLREELAVTLGIEGAAYEDVTSASIFGLYDALVEQCPDRVQKNEIHNNDGTFTNYEYVVSTGDYNDKSGSISSIDDIKKPKYLVASGLHGFEKPSIVATYRLFRDIVTGHNIPSHFREGCVIHFLPVSNPWGLDNDSRFNGNIDPKTNQGVDINRNFDWDFGLRVQADKADNTGEYAESEKETQAVANWLRTNTDAELFLDCHNVGSVPNEIVTIIGLTDSEAYDKRKKIALRGLDRVVQFWKDAIGYADSTIFPNTASFNEGGMSVFYASEKLGIPSLCLEISARPTGAEATSRNVLPETVAVGAEVIGNVLIEFYEQYSMGEVIEDMSAINAKIDKALSFRVETGVYTAETDSSGGTVLEIPCSPGAKIFAFVPDDATQSRVAALQEQPVFLGYIGQRVAKLTTANNAAPAYRGHQTIIRRKCTNADCADYNTFVVYDNYENTSDNTNGFKFNAIGLKAGTYNWTAYYWNE